MGQLNSFERLSLNQITTQKWNLRETIEGCVRAEISWIGLWRNKIDEMGIKQSKHLIRDAGLQISSLISIGWFSAKSAEERQKRMDDNRRAIEEAAELGAKTIVLLGGGLADRDISCARKWVEDGIEQLVPFARSYGVKIGIEPLHPMYTAERNVITTLAQARKLANPYPPEDVGIIVDVFHVWWDPDLYNQIELAGEENRILGFHVSDWLVPVPDFLLARGMMGDGVIEIRKIREAVDSAGYDGPIEVEILNQAIWEQPGDDIISLMKDRYIQHV